MADARESVFNRYLTGLRSSFKASVLRLNFGSFVPIAIFLLVWGSFVLLRLRFDIILTDTDYYMTGPRAFSWSALANIWRDAPPGWYRPLAYSAEYLLISFLWKNFIAIIPLQMLIPASSAVLLYFVAKDLSNGTRFLAAAAAIVYSFSLGVIEVSWLFVHKSILTDFLVLCTVLGYLRYVKTRHFGWFALMVFGALTVPWAREIGASVNAALLGAALLEGRKDIRLLAVLFFLTLHGIFPAFLTNLHFFHEVRLMSIFERSDWGLGLPFGSHPTLDVPFKVILYLSPIATILMLTSIVLFYLGQGRPSTFLAGAIVVVSIAGLVALFYPQSTTFTGIMALIFGIMIVATNLPRSKVIPLWFTCSLAPFVVMPAHDAWLRLASMPYIIMTFIWITELPANLRKVLLRLPGPRPEGLTSLQRPAAKTPSVSLAPALVFGVLVLIAVNNIIISFVTFRETIAQNKHMASWFTATASKGAALISSVRLLPDVQYYSNDWLDARYIRLPFTFPLPGGQVPALGRLDAVALSHSERGVYFMVSEKYGRAGYPDGISAIELEPIKTFVVSARYPMLDPFQAIIPERFRRYGGPTDTLHEFRLVHKPFWGEARAVFHFYKLNRHPRLIEEGYRGFNVVQWGDMVFGIPQGEPPFAPDDMFGAKHGVVGFGHSVEEAKRSIDEILVRTQNLTIQKLFYGAYAGFSIFYFDKHFYAVRRPEPFSLLRYKAHGYLEAFDAGAPDLVKLQIDDAYLTGVPPYAPADYHPALLIKDHRGFDVYSFRGRIYGIPSTEGSFDYERFTRNDYAAVVELFRADIDTVLGEIDSGRYDLHPRLLVEGFHEYNLLAYGTKFYAILQGEGAFDYRRFRDHGYPMGFAGDSLDRVRDAVLRHVSQDVPVTVGDYAGFAIAIYQGAFYATLPRQAPLDPTGLQTGRYRAVLRGRSLDEVRMLVAEHILQTAPLLPLYDDDGEGWAAEGGLSVTRDTRVLKSRKSNLKIAWMTSSGSAYYNFASPQNWSNAHVAGFYVYGSGGGAIMALQIRFKDQGGPNWVDFRWTDDFTGWKAMVFELNKPSANSGVVNWTDVRQVLVRPLEAKGFSLYFDHLVRDGAQTPLVQEDYLEFSITQYQSRYYAIPKTEGTFDLQKFRAGGYARILSGSSLNEVMTLIARNSLGETPRIVYVNDVSVWKAEPGIVLGQENHIVKAGTRSLKASWNASSGAVYYNFAESQNWSNSRYLLLWVYGAGSSETFALQVRFQDQRGPNWAHFRWKDDFTGWRPLIFDLRKPSKISGTVDWIHVEQALIRPLEKTTATLYVDYLARYKGP